MLHRVEEVPPVDICPPNMHIVPSFITAVCPTRFSKKVLFILGEDSAVVSSWLVSGKGRDLLRGRGVFHDLVTVRSGGWKMIMTMVE